VKNEGNNLGTMIVALRSIIDYELFKLLQVYEGTCFMHVMFKACQYGMNDEKVSVGLILVNVKMPILVCRKQSRKRKYEWEKACIECGMSQQ
jgi:hypothetical protein